MRLIKLLVSEDSLESTLDVLESENIDHVVTKEARERENRALVEFPLPTQAVEYVMNELRESGLDDREYTVIASAETAKTRNYSELEDRFVAGVEEDDSVAPEEIRAKALDMHRTAFTYYAMTIFSAIVAAAGLLLDSPAVVVGAMVIAPQVGSALIASVGMALDDRRMIWLGFRDQFVGLGLAIVGAFVFGISLKHGQIVTSVLDVSTVGQISKRISPGLLSMSVAFCAGAAGAFGLATALPVSLVGVMIAAALIPAAAAVGIGFAWGLPSVALGALVLLIVNAVAVNLAGFLVLWYFDYRPIDWEDDTADDMISTLRRYTPTIVGLVVLVATFSVAGGLVAAEISFTNDVNTAVEDVLEEDQYNELELNQVQAEVQLSRHVGETPQVSIVLSRPADAPYPGLADRLKQRIVAETERQVEVQVEFADVQRTEPPEQRE
ncbi:TIGR00341 family protein [Halogranum amylolyticum]|uniref:TIGR00341 family protein n=1 Tax=Halogranum amylolyticum TaxID=660520 RepID=A0A1H8SYQ8_9EURY|nr:TIGR00341 family protein [Halogranum amylolyticum]SEO83767.1 TIGR00341 family protein [Halogranum amylolyticum]